jgi:hypothetical protein
MIDYERDFQCPLCGIDFTGKGCQHSCPIAKGCQMIRCPRCGYEFVCDSKFIGLLRRLLSRGAEKRA